MEINFITSNKVKVDIATEVLDKYGVVPKQQVFNLKEMQAIDVKEVALDKASQAFLLSNKPFIIDDSGLYISTLNNFPGALLKTVYKAVGDEGLTRLLNGIKDRSALFINVLVFGDPATKEVKTFLTECHGRMAERASGSRKIGWAIERLFIPDGHSKPLAQFDDREWETFWVAFKENLHYNKFGKWAKSNL